MLYYSPSLKIDDYFLLLSSLFFFKNNYASWIEEPLTRIRSLLFQCYFLSNITPPFFPPPPSTHLVFLDNLNSIYTSSQKESDLVVVFLTNSDWLIPLASLNLHKNTSLKEFYLSKRIFQNYLFHLEEGYT